MSANKVKTPYVKFSDIDGNPLEDGYIYIGAINQNPEVVPVNTYWDEALTIPAAQPIRTIGGFPARSGTAANIFTAGDYSITVKNKNGTLIHTAPASQGLINSVNVDSIAELTGLEGYETVNVRGYYAANDGGGGLFNYDATQSAVNNGGTIINGWVRQYSGDLNVKWFGAKGDSSVDDTAAIQAAIDYAYSITVFERPVVYLPAGEYDVTALVWKTDTMIKGDSRRNSVLNAIGGSGVHVINGESGVSLGGSSQYIRDIYFKNTLAQNNDAINLNASSHVNGIVIENCWFNGFQYAVNLSNTADNFGNVWIKDTVIEVCQNGINANGNETGGFYSGKLELNNILFFRVNTNPIFIDFIEESRLINIQFAQCSYVTSSSTCINIRKSKFVTMDDVTIKSAAGSSFIHSRSIILNGVTDSTIDNIIVIGAENTTSGILLQGICNNLTISNSVIKDIKGTAGVGIIVGDGVNACSDIRISDLIIDSTTEEGIDVLASSDAIINNVSIKEPYYNDAVTVTRKPIRVSGSALIKNVKATGTNINVDSGLLGFGYDNDTSSYVNNTLFQGSIIETGTNVNGRYIKYSDGTLITVSTATVSTTNAISNRFGSTSGTMYQASAAFTFPIAFTVAPTVLPTAANNVGLGLVFQNGTITTTTAGVTAIHYVSGTSVDIKITAIGRWK